MGFSPEREAGKDILFVEGLTKTVDGVKVLDNVSFIANKTTRSPWWETMRPETPP